MVARNALTTLSETLQKETSALKRMSERWNAVGGTPKALWLRDAAVYIADFYSLASIGRSDGDFIIRWVQNREGSLDAINFDLKTRADRYDRLRYLLRAKKPASSGPIALNYGALGFVYDISLKKADGSFDGFLHGVFEYRRLLHALSHPEPGKMPIAEGAALLINDRVIINNMPRLLPRRSDDLSALFWERNGISASCCRPGLRRKRKRPGR